MTEIRLSRVRTLEWALLASFSLVVVFLHIVLYRHAGSFWRDEIFTIESASLPTFSAMWASLAGDSFPGLFGSLLRLWILAGPGATDGGIRLFGTLLALAAIFSLIISCRMLTRNVPLVAFGLVAMNGTVFYFGSSLRAYGLAIMLVAPCFAAFWAVVRAPTRLNSVSAFILALLMVHSAYQNACLLLGLSLAGVGACLMCRLWRRCLLVASIGVGAALTMLIYIPIIRRQSQFVVIPETAPDWSAIIKTWALALTGGSPILLV